MAVGAIKKEGSISVLVIDNDKWHGALLGKALAKEEPVPMTFECCGRLNTALERLSKRNVEVVLLSLGLPAAGELSAVRRFVSQFPEIPLVLLCTPQNEAKGLEGVRLGAQDYLIKGTADRQTITRSLRCAVTRHHLQAELRSLSMIDDLTGLHNRRGFLSLAEQQLQIASRANRNMALLFADVDGLKQINDTLGHSDGDQALIDTATVLKQTFRKSDVVGRIGGDEFAVVAVEAHCSSTDILINRIYHNISHLNAREARRYQLSLSVGVAHLESERTSSVEVLMSRADRALYAEKQTKDRLRAGSQKT